MKLNLASPTGSVIRGLVCGLIYFVIAVATGARAVHAILAAVIVAIIVIALSVVFTYVMTASRRDGP